MKCLVIGFGLLGKKLAEKLQEKGHTFSAASDDLGHGTGESNIDISDKGAVEALLKKESPEVVFLTAAVTNVDYCEKNREEAFRVNVEGVKNVASVCKEQGCLLVFYSGTVIIWVLVASWFCGGS